MSPIVPARRVLSLVIVLGLAGAACSSSKSSNNTTAPGVPPSSVPTTVPELTGAGLNLGVLAPPPGLGATLFQAQTRGIAFAANDIAVGGGVLNGPLNVSTTETPLGKTEADTIGAVVDGGARVLIGPASSTSAAAAIPELTRLKTIACSASATVPGLTAGQEQPSLFRTAIPDDVLATYLASKIVERRDAAAPGAAWKVAIVARTDDYGLAVGNGLAEMLKAQGLEPVVVGYNEQRVEFAGTAAEVAAKKPDVTILISFEEGPALLSALVGAGLAPKTMVGLDGFFAPRLGAIAGGGKPESLDGFSVLGTTGDKAFLKRLATDNPNGQVAYAAQAYDCAVVLALAAQEVESDKAKTIATAVQDVTAGGLVCTTYSDCHAKQAAGENIDYEGVSGKLAIDKHGDPTSARFTTGEMKGGVLVSVTTTDVDLAKLARQKEAFAAGSFNTRLQQSLRFLGFYSGPIDGLESPELTAAVAAFQTSVGLPPTGIYDAETDKALRAALGTYGDLLASSTKGLQELLTTLGFYSGPLDGVWSPAVTDAIKALQKELGVPQTGVPDAATLKGAYLRGLTTGTTATTVPGVTPPPETAPPVTTIPETTVPPATTVPPVTTPPVGPVPTVPQGPLVSLFDTLKADPQYSTFVELLLISGFSTDAELIGPYTVFAPTNAAFDKLPAGVLASLRDNPATLQSILGYHVVEGLYPSAKLTGSLATVNGARVAIAGAAPTLTVGGSNIILGDLKATNGVIHTIDSLIQTVTAP